MMMIRNGKLYYNLVSCCKMRNTTLSFFSTLRNNNTQPPRNWLNANKLADDVFNEAKERIGKVKKNKRYYPISVTTLVFNEPGKEVFNIAEKHAKRLAKQLDIEWKTKLLPNNLHENEVIAAITALNYDTSVTGIVCSRPLPPHLSARKIHESVHPLKDVEGMHPTSMGRVVYGTPILWPCTAKAAVELCASARKLQGLEALVIGTNDVIAKPICSILQSYGATVTVCQADSPKLPVYARGCDAVFTSQGSKDFVLSGDMLKPGCTLIDVGFRIDKTDGKIYGDADLESCFDVCSGYATIQHGIALLRTSYLLLNVAIAAELS